MLLARPARRARAVLTGKRPFGRYRAPSGQPRLGFARARLLVLPAGLTPVRSQPDVAGAGLWLIHVLGLDAALIRSPDGFTVRLVARHAS